MAFPPVIGRPAHEGVLAGRLGGIHVGNLSVLPRGKDPTDDAVPWHGHLPQGFLAGKLQPCVTILLAKLQEGKASFVGLFLDAAGKQQLVDDGKGRVPHLACHRRNLLPSHSLYS